MRAKLTLDPGEELTRVNENLIDLFEPPGAADSMNQVKRRAPNPEWG
ncbi:hypothetical protein QFZ70_002011 [Arthrobacter sp. V1I9]|nr:hypothetical protein [Arthrobacter sp. V1I9]MDQ0869538.1 hypothetical protein [Arthrobacter sp. V1I9]